MYDGKNRREPQGEPFITVGRNVPVWTLVTGLVALVAMGVNLQVGQSEQAKRMTELSAQFSQFNANYTAEIASKVKVQLTIESLQQRVAALEAAGAARKP